LRYVLDTQFFLSGMDPTAIDGEVFITPEIIDEVKKGFPSRKMEYFLESGQLSVASPSPETLKFIREKAEETGDIGRLSETDISILALALDLSAAIITDDYSVQNLADLLDISYITLNEQGIRRIWKWAYRCKGCGRIFYKEYKECPVCGSPLRQIPLKK